MEHALKARPGSGPTPGPWESTSLGPERYGEILEVFKEVACAATAVGTSEQLNQLLHLVGKRICELTNVRRCSVYLRAEDGSSLFKGRAGYCTSEEIDDRVRRLVSGIDGDGFTREIVESKRPVLVSDAAEDERTIRRTMVRWHVRDMLGVPLVAADDVIGIIYIDNLQYEHVYTEDQIHVAQTFASLAALAIRQASLFSQLNHRAAVIDQQRQILRQVIQAHEKLTHAVLSGMEFDGLVDLIAQIVGKPVLTFNDRFELMALGGPTGMDLESLLGSGSVVRNPAKLGNLWRAVDATKPSTLIPPAAHTDGPPFRQLICPMVIDERSAGYLVLLEVGTSLGALDAKVGEQGATVLTIKLLTEFRQSEEREQAREDFLSDLLDGGRDPASLRRRVRVLGVDLDQPHVVVRVGTVPAGRSTADRRYDVTVALERELGLGDIMSTRTPAAQVLLLPLPPGPEIVGLRRVKAAVMAATSASVSGAELSAVISTVCRDIDDFPRAHHELRSLSETLEHLGEGRRVVLAGELGVLRLLAMSTPHREAVVFARELLGPLLSYDEQNGAQLADTLRVLLEQDGQVRATAKALGVHENTVRYRLGRVRELSVSDPERISSLLDLRFAFQILELTGELGTAELDAGACAEPQRRGDRSGALWDGHDDLTA